MKRYFIILITLFSSCLSSKSSSVTSDTIVLSIFPPSQVLILDSIAQTVDSLILSQTFAKNVDDAYHQYCNYLSDSDDMKELVARVDRNRDFYNTLVKKLKPLEIFNEIWSLNPLFYPKENVTYEFLNMNTDGKYVRFLDAYSKVHKNLRGYYDVVYNYGAILPPVVFGILAHHKNFDFSKPPTRLIFAIHFITIHYQTQVSQN